MNNNTSFAAGATPAMTGVELYAARSSYGMSLKDLARLVQVNERTLRRWETGATIPKDKAFLIHSLDDVLKSCVSEITDHARLSDGTLPEAILVPGGVPEMPTWARHPLGFFVTTWWRASLAHGFRLVGKNDTWKPESASELSRRNVG